MKPLKMLGLTALAALLAMAIIGATSAMAEPTLLCKADENPCKEANVVTSVHETTNGTPATLLSSAGSVTCEVSFASSSVHVVREKTTSETIVGNFTYSSCLRNGTEACTAEEKNGPVEISILKTGHETGEVTGKGEVNLHCGSFINCTYNGTGLKGTAKGPLLSSKTNGSVELSEQTTNHVGGLFCPSTAKLDITTTPLSPTYVTSGLGYCVETQHTNGIYTNSTCTTLGSPSGHKYQYTLIIGPEGGAVNETTCYEVLTPYYGLWKKFNAFRVACEEDVEANGQPYEKGTVKTVE